MGQGCGGVEKELRKGFWPEKAFDHSGFKATTSTRSRSFETGLKSYEEYGECSGCCKHPRHHSCMN